MMINKIFFSFFACVSVFFAFMTCAHAELTAKTVVCGDVQSCNLDTHMCYKRSTLETGDGLTNTTVSYVCVLKGTEMKKEVSSDFFGDRMTTRVTEYTEAPNGGTGKENTTSALIFSHTTEKDQCKTQYFKQKYEPCYPCEVIIVLFSAFLTAASAAYDATKQAANAILIVASILWIAGFAMKNVSSFTSVEPMKMLQDLFIKFFKIILAFVIINSGLQAILHYSLVPIINTGTDFANTILASTSDYTPDLYNEDFISARAGGGGASSPTGGGGYSGGGSGGGAR